MAKHKGSEWRKLTREDLRGWDAEPKKLVLWAMDQGAVGKISNRGHAILRGTDGRTASVSPKWVTANRSGQNARASVARLFRRG